jgi:hypothetical protein
MTVVDWLLDSDPSIRWQVMRDLTHEQADVIAAERSRVATEGWGEQLLALQESDGRWGGRPWSRDYTDTFHVLELLRRLGLDPRSEQAQRAVGLVREHVTWRDPDFETPWADNRFFDGEVEPCINGNVVATGAYFGVDTSPLVDRLLGEQLPDGGWNCEVENGATVSSFGTTINVLEGLLAHERAISGSADVRAARSRGEAYLLERRLFRRKTTGEAIDPAWLRFSFPTWWHYDVLRGLEYLRDAAIKPDERVAEAIGLVEGARDPDGRWPLQNVYAGETHVQMEDGQGKPSRWNTLRALRVLDWFTQGQRGHIFQLQDEVEDLRTSRRRLVSAADADRRAIEGALHDGVQQHLIALAVDLRRLAGLVDADPVAAQALLDEMMANLRTAMAETTALAERIHPPLLAARGFASAIRSAAERLGVTVLVDAPAGAGYSPEVTTAVYWSCVETLSFASRGSEATVIVLDTDGVLTFEVGIDGRLSDEGLARLCDRVEALDGRVAVDDRTDDGSRLHGWLPSS